MPIYIRITVDGQSREMTTSRSCDRDLWDQKAGKACGKSEYIKELNIHLSTLQVKVFEARLSLIANNKIVTAEEIKNLLRGKSEKSKMILEVFKAHNERMAQLINSEFSPATFERYKTSMGHTRSFIKWKYGVEDIEIDKLDFEFISDYEFWLKTMRKCNHNTSIKYIGNFKKIVNGCIRRGWLTKDPFLGFKMAKREVERIALSKEDLQILSNKVLLVSD